MFKEVFLFKKKKEHGSKTFWENSTIGNLFGKIALYFF
jgi:hypothetical protein